MPDFTVLTDQTELADYLRHKATYPLFAKPVYADVGSGGYGIEAYEAANDYLLLTNGERLPVTQFGNELTRKRKYMVTERGYLFQDFIRQNAEITKRCSLSVCSVRLILLVDAEGPKPFRAIWRIATGTSMTDNFNKGDAGNLIAAVDLASGEITRVVNGYGLNQSELSHHPNTGEALVGFRLPFWREGVDLCCQAARVFPMLHMQHWDLAFTDHGPILIEVNSLGSIDMIQYATGYGVHDAAVRAVLDQYGVKDRFGRLVVWPWSHWKGSRR